MISDEKKAELDAAAAERAATLGQPHVVDGSQPYHAGALTPETHVPGNLPSAADLDAVADEQKATAETGQSNG
jgi:hypothetical protein